MYIELIVVPAPLLEALQAADVPLEHLTDPKTLAQYLSARDLLSLEQAGQDFPYREACSASGFSLTTPKQVLVNQEAHVFLYNRVKELLATAELKAVGTPTPTHSYSLHKPIGDKLWVAVQQRLAQDSDPSEKRLTSNIGFLEDLIGALLQRQRWSFESVAELPVFASYLKELSQAPANA